MANIQSLELQMSSGDAGTTYQTVERTQQATYGANLETVPVRVMGKFSPLRQQSVMNYVPVQLNVAFIKSSNEVETNFGLLNPTGAGIVFAGKNGLSLAGYGARNFKLLQAPSQTNNYQGEVNIFSGVLTSYSVSASVGEPARASFVIDALDQTNALNSNGRPTQSYNAALVIPENVRISGIDVSGYGLSGISTQSFDLAIGFSRQSAYQLGRRFPERIMSDINAQLTLRGYFEGTHASYSGTSVFNCGEPYSGTIYISLVPACGGGAGTTYAIKNPYLASYQVGAQIGAFTSVDLTFTCPISVNSGECVSGSNVIIT